MDTIMDTLKRKYEEDNMDEATIEAELAARVAARKQARVTTRPLINKLQRLYAEWRETDDDDIREEIEDEIAEYEEKLAVYGLNFENHTMYDVEVDNRGMHTGKQITFAERPRVATYFYPEEKRRKKSPTNRHSSLGEIFRHNSEMRAALRDSIKEPIIYEGGMYGGGCTCNQSRRKGSLW